jgi:hypothetical protein
MSHTLNLTGLDGANPLAFLAALGALRLADQVYEGRCRLSWASAGAWVPALEVPDGVTAEGLVADLHARTHRTADPAAAGVAREKERAYARLKKVLKEAEGRVRGRKLRGDERAAALREEVEPVRRQAEAARSEWLAALEKTVPAPFLALGKALSVTEGEYRDFARRVFACLPGGGAGAPNLAVRREDADFAASFGSEACLLPNGKIVPTEFQLITGSGHQFFLETFGALMEEVTEEKLRRCLFEGWAYGDLRRSFRWDPGEDRRYAYGWSDPSGEEVRTEHGANLLAAMALPLFPSVPVARGLATTGFEAGRRPAAFTWPLWGPPVGADVVRSLLALKELHDEVPDRGYLRRLGVVEVFRTSKIEVGRPPLSKWNLTPPVAV